MGFRQSMSSKQRGAQLTCLLRPPKQPFLEEWTNPQNVRCDNAEANDNKTDKNRECRIEYEVVAIGREEGTNRRKVGEEQEMYEVNIQRTSSDIL